LVDICIHLIVLNLNESLMGLPSILPILNLDESLIDFG
jgi:hypothetical protein